METLAAYIPMDRQQSLVSGVDLPERMSGTALFADISGFTPLTEALALEFGPQRGAEELTLYLNRVFTALIAEVDRYHGSVVSFSGDAITCWFGGDSSPEAVPASLGADLSSTASRGAACALAMQAAMRALDSITIPSSSQQREITLAMKAALATGSVRRFLVGDPALQQIDTLAGSLVDRLAEAEHQAGKGEILIDPETCEALAGSARIGEWRDSETGQSFAVLTGLSTRVGPRPWPEIPAGVIDARAARPWLLPAVYERLQAGQGEFLAELRPGVSFFLRFSGIDFESDPFAGEKLDKYLRQIQQSLARYEASLVQLTIGDKGSYLQAAFGAPVAHEDDPRRALAVALELKNLQVEFITSVQFGISKGRMRTGAYGGPNRRTYGIMGDDVNLAARLMQAARPGQILVSTSICQGIEDDYLWEELPPLKVKGKSKPVQVFGLLGYKTVRGSQLRAPRYSLPMVGRQEALAQIEEQVQAARAGQGRMVGITGEAGVGKSRLVAEAIRLANEHGFTGFSGECQSFGTNISYLVWGDIWRGYWGLDLSVPVGDQVRRLEEEITRTDPALAARLPLLGALLNLPIPDNDLTASFDAKLRKASLESLLVDYLRARRSDQPLLFVLDDCQWIDPLSHDLLEVIGRATQNLPVLILMAYRSPLPDRLAAPRVSLLPHFTQIELAEFSAEEAEQLITLKLKDLFGPASQAPAGLMRLITSRAEGNPFYIEEILNYLRDRAAALPDPTALDSLDLPASLHSLILSRIDQLTESQKTILKVASVIGRLFRAAMLWGTYPSLGEPARVIADLDRMVRLDLVSQDAPEPELVYLFKHILTQEVAYESLPFATRSALHGQIGAYIERTYPGTLDQYIDLLAFHYDRGEDAQKREEYLLKAGEAAQRNYANAAAIDYYQRALPLLTEAGRIPVLLKLGKVLELVGKWDEAGERYLEALQLADRLEDRHARAWSVTAHGDLLRKLGRYDEAETWLAQALYTFEDLSDEAGIGQALHYAGTLAAQQGDYEQARLLYEQSLAIRRKLGDRPQIASLLSNLGIIARLRGDAREARALHEEGLAIRRQLGDKWAIAVSLNNLGNVALDEENLDEAQARLEEALALQREVGDRWSVANAFNNLGNLARTQGDYPRAKGLYNLSLEIYQEFGDRRALAYLLEDMGGLAALEDRPRRALRLVGSASALRQEIGSPLSAKEQEALDRLLENAHRELDELAQAVAFGEGRSMTAEEAIRYARKD
jgi:predicted ATPase/class 3 adenylate cyclase